MWPNAHDFVNFLTPRVVVVVVVSQSTLSRPWDLLVDPRCLRDESTVQEHPAGTPRCRVCRFTPWCHYSAADTRCWGRLLLPCRGLCVLYCLRVLRYSALLTGFADSVQCHEDIIVFLRFASLFGGERSLYLQAFECVYLPSNRRV